MTGIQKNFDYELVVGMEIHVELKTVSKMFCGCRNDPFHAPKPNIYTCPVCLGMPGGLPVANRKAIQWTILLGLALGSKIPEFSKFDRKNYFYPDLPKGYQISQYDHPLAIGGKVETEYGEVRINHIHLEEDAGKLIHTELEGKKVTLIDFNRSGVPLVEIVTEPDIRSGDQAKAFLKNLHQTVRYLGISDADMEKGTMRLEPNISLRPQGQISLPGYKVEVKNINSFKFVKKAIEYEFNRQKNILSKGEIPLQETRGYSEAQGKTFPQRIKGGADDYRYFPDPDLPPIEIKKDMQNRLKDELPELPEDKKNRFKANYGLSEADAKLLTETSAKADYFEKAVGLASAPVIPKMISNWIINKKIDLNLISPQALLGQITSATVKPEIPDSVYEEIVTNVIKDQPEAVAEIKAGREQVMMFLLGQAKRIEKNLDPAKTITIIRQKIASVS
jgi:aspartyl-tRNA(Asn)/glutamyl-tRNA(Gln) amidotransferase subunit B